MDEVTVATRPARRPGSWGRAAALAGVLGLASAVVGVAGAQTGTPGQPGRPDQSASGAAIPEAQAEVFVSLTPSRVLDTRPIDGGPIGGPAAKLGPGQTIDLALVGSGKPLPAEASSAVLNVTLDQDASLKSFLTIWPKGEARPNASANNAEPGLVASNSMIARLGADRSVSIYNHQGDTNVIIDVVGYLAPADAVQGLGQQTLVSPAAPLDAEGDEGDLWLNSTTNQLYGPKTNGQWGSPVTTLGGGGSGAVLVDETPSGACSNQGEIALSRLSGELRLCDAGSWGGDELASTYDLETTYANHPAVGLIAGQWVDVARRQTDRFIALMADGSVTVTQTQAEAMIDEPSHVECRWILERLGSPMGTVSSHSFYTRSSLTVPNTVSLNPMGRSEFFGDGDFLVLQCRLTTASTVELTAEASSMVVRQYTEGD